MSGHTEAPPSASDPSRVAIQGGSKIVVTPTGGIDDTAQISISVDEGAIASMGSWVLLLEDWAPSTKACPCSSGFHFS